MNALSFSTKLTAETYFILYLFLMAYLLRWLFWGFVLFFSCGVCVLLGFCCCCCCFCVCVGFFVLGFFNLFIFYCCLVWGFWGVCFFKMQHFPKQNCGRSRTVVQKPFNGVDYKNTQHTQDLHVPFQRAIAL